MTRALWFVYAHRGAYSETNHRNQRSAAREVRRALGTDAPAIEVTHYRGRAQRGFRIVRCRHCGEWCDPAPFSRPRLLRRLGVVLACACNPTAPGSDHA